MAAPLIHRDKTLGVVEVLNPKDRVAFTEPDLLLLRLFTNLGAVAMSNARDFARIEREYRVMHDSWLCHPRIVGKSPALQKTLGEGRVVAKANTSVLIEGPTGTGKELLARLIDKLKATKEADGSSLFDHTAVAFGSNISSIHYLTNCPTVITGGGANLKLGQHLVVEEDTPLCNVWLTMLQGMGINADQHGDSTGVVKELQS